MQLLYIQPLAPLFKHLKPHQKSCFSLKQKSLETITTRQNYFPSPLYTLFAALVK